MNVIWICLELPHYRTSIHYTIEHARVHVQHPGLKLEKILKRFCMARLSSILIHAVLIDQKELLETAKLHNI